MAGAICAVMVCIPARAVPGISAQKAILVDADSGKVLFSRDADSKSLIASTTKILTALIICEECDLKQVVQIPGEAVGIEGSSMYLQEGEMLTVEQLLYGLMLRSGNDAAVALALHCAGSVEQFVEKMNERAAALGMNHSHFCNPHGLDAEEHYATARDLAILAVAAMRNETLRRISATKSISFAGRSLQNHNKLLWRYEGAIGVKTGYTKAAGRILVSAAERKGRRLICVSIHAPDDWQDHMALLDYGFSCFSEQVLLPKDACVARVQLLGGEWVNLYTTEEVKVSLLPGEQVVQELCCPDFAWQVEEFSKATLVVRLYGMEWARVLLAATVEDEA